LSFEITLLALRLAFAVLLYLFLAAAFWILWKDLAAPGGQQEAIEGRLLVLNGDGAGLLEGEILPLAATTTLGRERDNTIVIGDPFASAHHARLTRRDGAWWLADLGSHNGTLLNDLPIHEPVPLAAGDVISIGQVKLQLIIGNQQLSGEEGTWRKL
jgi:hypothetical protein